MQLFYFQVTADIEKLYTFDYRLVTEPKIAERFLETSHKVKRFFFDRSQVDFVWCVNETVNNNR